MLKQVLSSLGGEKDVSLILFTKGELISENGVMYGQYPVNVTYVWNGQPLKRFRIAWKDKDNDPSETPPVFGFGSGTLSQSLSNLI